MTAKRRLVYLSLETPREGQATYTHVHEIVRGLREIGWQVDLIATGRGGASSGTGYLTRLFDYVRAQWALARRLGSCDGVYMRAHFAAMPVSLLARLRGVPVFQEINGLPADIFVTYRWLRWLGPLIVWLYRVQMRMAAHVFVVTEGLRGWAEAQSGHGRVSVVSNGADIRLFTPEGPPPPTQERYIAFVGGITAWHGISVMIAAVDDPAWPPELRLVIIGDGVEREQLQRPGLSPRISWLGRRPPQEVATWLRGAVAALSITQDSTGHLGTGVAPLKLFEAMASGVPVIVTDLPFQRDVVRQHEAGLVIPMADAPALARAAAELASDPERAKRLGRNGADYVRANASWGKRAEEIAERLAPVLDAPSAGKQ